MKKIIFIVFVCASFACAQTPGNSSSGSSIIPAPVSFKSGSGSFNVQKGTAITLSGNSDELKGLADFLIFHPMTKGLNLAIRNAATNTIKLEILKTTASDLGTEGYSLSVTPTLIHLRANKPQGLFYGIQSLLQLFPVEGNAPFKIASCEITDQPRFAWRGLMLDVSRHFFTVPEVKQYIDAMAMYKFNTLHLHLTDDNGWRIEIKSLPKLTSIGAWRAERAGTFGDRPAVKDGEPATYGGFYTHEQIKDLVKYAAAKQITIVPEIETPGHAMAILAAYPELSCTHEKVYVNPGTAFSEWYGNGKFKMLVDNTLNPANEKVYEYLDKIFTEVAMLFPNPYIHVGGDECYHGYWEEDASVKALMAKEKFTDIHQVQSYFISRLEKILKSKNKKLIGWDEILEGGLAPDATVMSWRGMQGGIDAAKLGHDVVMSPTTFTYIDYMQGDRSLEFPIYASLTLKKTYSFEPVPDEVNPKYILGGQANLWTEKVPTIRHAFYMTFPRAFAVSESLWSPKSAKDWNGFTSRVEQHFKRFDQLQWNISRSVYDGTAAVSKKGNDILVTLTTELPGATIHYTLDNTFPDAFSPKYAAPFRVPEGDVTLRFVVVRGGKIMGRMAAIHRTDLISRAK